VNPRGGGRCTPSSAADQVLAVAMEMGEEAVGDKTDGRTQVEGDP